MSGPPSSWNPIQNRQHGVGGGKDDTPSCWEELPANESFRHDGRLQEARTTLPLDGVSRLPDSTRPGAIREDQR